MSRGDQIELIDSEERLRAFMGPVDSVRDAEIVARLKGEQFDCSTARETTRGFESTTTDLENLGGRTYRTLTFRVEVSKTGEVRKVITKRGPRKQRPRIVRGRLPGPWGSAECERMALGDLQDIASYLAFNASYEAAAVLAFEQMAVELTAHEAPSDLIRRCRVAAQDEARHAEAMGALARNYGAEPVAVAAQERQLPTLLELARENLVEGCVKETFAAASTLLQARTARDPAIAAVLSVIAPEEVEHAVLSWDLHQWFCQQLPDVDFEALEAAAWDQLRAEQAGCSAVVAEAAGEPNREVALDLAAGLAA